MKKILLSLGAIALGLSVSATSVTFDFTQSSYGQNPYNEDLGNNTPYVETPATLTEGDVTILLEGDIDNNATGWRFWSDGLREYYKRNPKFTVSVKGTNVTGVELAGKSAATFALEGTTDNITTWSGSASSVTFVCTASSNAALTSITVYYDEEFVEQPADPDPDVDEFTVAEALAWLAAGNSGTAIVNGVVTDVTNYNGTYGSVTYYLGDTENATETLQIYSGYGLNGEKFSSQNDVVVGSKVQVKGTLKIYVNANGEEIYEMDMNSVMLSYQLPDGYEEPAAPEGVLTVAEALQWIEGGYSGLAIVKGVISAIEEISTQYGNATYTIKDSLEGNDELIVYRGYWLEGEKFTAEDALEIGATVEVEGTLVNYNGTTPEFTTGSKILSYSTAGVESIFDDNAPAVYYNLQGVRVNNPSNGIFIVNGKKVLVK